MVRQRSLAEVTVQRSLPEVTAYHGGTVERRTNGGERHAGEAGHSAGRWIERHRNSQAATIFSAYDCGGALIQAARSGVTGMAPPFVLRVSVAPLLRVDPSPPSPRSHAQRSARCNDLQIRLDRCRDRIGFQSDDEMQNVAANLHDASDGSSS